MSGAGDGRAEVRDIVHASGSSFLAGMRMLPPSRRAAIYAIYAFCRVVDDIADGPGSASDKVAGLTFWERELAAARAGAPATAIGVELLAAARAHDLPFDEFDCILEGMRMDATGIVAPDDATFERYVRCVAGAVGILSMHAFGAWRGAVSERFALSLARGLQITNILRDIGEDAGRGRLYLPRSVLEAAGVPADPRLAVPHPGLGQARASMGREARRSFAEAMALVPSHSRRRILPALMMMGPYARLLTAMEADWQRQPLRRPGWRKAADGIGFALRQVALSRRAR